MKVHAFRVLEFLTDNDLDYGPIGNDPNFFWFIWNESDFFCILKNYEVKITTYYDDEVEAALLQELSLALG